MGLYKAAQLKTRLFRSVVWTIRSVGVMYLQTIGQCSKKHCSISRARLEVLSSELKAGS